MNRRDRRRQKQRRQRDAKAAASRVPPAAHTGPVELFRVTRMREATVRFVQVLVLLLAPAVVWGAHHTAFDPADVLNQRGEAVSWAVRYGTAALLFAIGVGGAIGMVVYGWCYVTRAVWDPESGRCRMTLLGLFAPVRVDVPLADEPRYRYDEGFSRAGGTIVNAPYYGIRIPGRRLPLIVDLQGEFPHADLFHRVLLAPARSRWSAGSARRKPGG